MSASRSGRLYVGVIKKMVVFLEPTDSLEHVPPKANQSQQNKQFRLATSSMLDKNNAYVLAWA